jgi:hypothetical protein
MVDLDGASPPFSTHVDMDLYCLHPRTSGSIAWSGLDEKTLTPPSALVDLSTHAHFPGFTVFTPPEVDSQITAEFSLIRDLPNFP